MNVKPGDLAILINAALQENIGKIIEVVEFIGIPKFINDGNNDYWKVKINSTFRVQIHSAEGIDYGEVPPGSFLFQRESWLFPISGLPDNEEIKDEKPIKEIA